jgi:hypothetical protein
MKEDQYRTSMEIMKGPLNDRISGRMKEEAMSRLQARQGRKVKEEGKDKVGFLEPRQHITNSEKDECMMKLLCWLEVTVKIHKKEEYQFKNEAQEILKWIVWYKFLFSVGDITHSPSFVFPRFTSIY